MTKKLEEIIRKGEILRKTESDIEKIKKIKVINGISVHADGRISEVYLGSAEAVFTPADLLGILEPKRDLLEKELSEKIKETQKGEQVK
jgi:ribosome-binding factor A